MNRQTLRDAMYRLTEIEKKRKAGEDIPNPFYEHLRAAGAVTAEGYFHFADPHIPVKGHHAGNDIWDILYRSPHQAKFILNRSQRHFKEPFAFGDFIGIRYCYDGTVLSRTPKEEFVLHKNDILLCNARIVLSQYLSCDNDIAFTLIFHRESLLRSIIHDMKGGNVVAQFIMDFIMNTQDADNYIIFHGEGNEQITTAIEDMLCEFIEPTEFGDTLLDAYIKILLTQMVYCPFEYNRTPQGKSSLALLEILNYIDRNYRDVTLEMLARHFGYSEKYLSRMIHEKSGRRFKELVTDKKMDHACLLLTSSGMTISDILLHCGFSNETYFYKQFRKRYGKSPKDYRADGG